MRVTSWSRMSLSYKLFESTKWLFCFGDISGIYKQGVLPHNLNGQHSRSPSKWTTEEEAGVTVKHTVVNRGGDKRVNYMFIHTLEYQVLGIRGTAHTQADVAETKAAIYILVCNTQFFRLVWTTNKK